MKQITILFLCALLLCAACKDKMVCAAFQSSYILDKEKQKERFSYFKGDSLVLEANLNSSSKNIYGLSEKEYGYWQKQRLYKVEPEDVYSDEVDSLLNSPGEKSAQMAESGVDSLATQEAGTVQLEEGKDPWSNTKRFHYNVDFVKYMQLVGNDVLLRQAAARDSAEAKQERQPAAADASGDAEKGQRGFLRNLFGGNKSEKEKESVKTEETLPETEE